MPLMLGTAEDILEGEYVGLLSERPEEADAFLSSGTEEGKRDRKTCSVAISPGDGISVKDNKERCKLKFKMRLAFIVS